MNKTAIRNFAIWARNKLIADVSYKAGLMGITSEGISDALSQSTLDVEFYDIGTAEPYVIRNEEIKQRKGLVDIIRQKEKESDYATAYSSVIEEVAYTWFNRLIAVRFMEINDYIPAHIRVLSSETGKLEPDIVTTPFDAELELTDVEKEQIIELKNDNKLDECFRMLFIKQCNALHSMLPRLFENTSDYSELLLNVSFVDQDGVIYHLVHDIDEDDFNIEKGGQVEIIGWLYQYYNSELKDETFALLKNNVKVTKERIPSATQLFTPDWIVRYMVENSLGRLWIEGHPNDTLKSGWKYYLDEAEQEADVQEKLDEIHAKYAKLTPEDIKVIDPCMGSGHILVYSFDVLMQIYESVGYTQRDAAKSILENNLFGLDIDERAAQLAYFAVLMKARQYNRRILNDYVTCNVYAIRESNGIDRDALNILGEAKNIGEKLVDTFIDAKEYGSILKVDITADELVLLDSKLDELKNKTSFSDVFEAANSDIVFDRIVPLLLQAKLMLWKYDVVITNPPYRGIGDVSEKLQKYANDVYPNSKSDLSTICMDCFMEILKKYGYVAMINIPVWMTLSSYEDLRKSILGKMTVINLLHLGRGIFGSDFGTVSFVFMRGVLSDYLSINRRLFEKKGAVESVDIKLDRFINRPKDYIISQKNYLELPGCTFSYGVNENYIKTIKSADKVSSIATVFEGLKTRDNDRFLRVWFEIKDKKWKPYSKGGSFRRWYGNNEYVVNWGEDGNEVRNFKKSSGANFKYYFQPAVTYTAMTMSKFSGRYIVNNIFGGGGGGITNSDKIKHLLAFFNTNTFDSMISEKKSTVNFEVGQIGSIPVLYSSPEIEEKIEKLVEQNVKMSRKDWDSFETSWDFKKNPLI